MPRWRGCQDGGRPQGRVNLVFSGTIYRSAWDQTGKDQVWVGTSSVLYKTMKVHLECSIFKAKEQTSSSPQSENLRAAVIVLLKDKGAGQGTD